MYRKFFNWIVRFPSSIALVTVLVSVLSIYAAKEGLIVDGALKMDTTIKPFTKQGEGSAYDFFQSLKKEGFHDNRTVEELEADRAREDAGIVDDGEEVVGENVALVLKLGDGQKMDLEFFMNLEKWTNELGNDPDVVASSIQSLLTAEYLRGACIGKPLPFQPAIGNVCESTLDSYRNQLECVRNKDFHLAQLAEEASMEEDLGFEDDLSFDEDPTAEEEETFFDSFVCSADILEKTETQLLEEAEAKIAEVVKEIEQQTLLHKRVISADFRTSVINFGLVKGAKFKAFISENFLPILDDMKENGMEIGWISGSRTQNVITGYINTDMKNILPATIFLMLMSLYVSFRNVFGMVLPFIVVTFALIMTAGVVGLSGVSMNTVTSAVPALLICVGNDYAIHFISYYMKAAREEPEKTKKELVFSVLNHLLVPLSVTALTTVGGFSALMISDIPAIQDLGLFASVGVVLSIFLTLTFLPAVLLILPRPKAYPEAKRNKKTLLDKALDVLANSVEKYPARVMLFWFVLTMVFAAGIGLVKVDGDSNPIDPQHPMMLDKKFFIDNFAGSQSLMVVMTGKDSPEQLMTAETINGIQAFKEWVLDPNNEEILKIPGFRMDRVDSVLDYLDLNRNGLDNLADKEVVTHFQTSRRYGWKPYISANEEMLLVELQYKGEAIPARLQFSALVAERFPDFLPNIDFRYSGNALIVGEAQDKLARGQLESVVLALVFVFIILSALFLSIKIGFLSLIPNVIPVLIFFGTLGFTGIPIGFTVSLIAAIVLGIGVDDTIHYLTHHNMNVKKFRDEEKAALFTIRQVGRPMTYTTISLGLGFIIFVLSGIFNQRIFGVLVAYTFVVCLLTDTHFLPAMMSKVKMITAWDYAGLKLNQAMLNTISLFKNMSLREAKLATLMAFTIDLKKGEVLFNEKDEGNELYVVLKGSLEYYLDPRFHSEKKILANYQVGDTLGEMGLFGQSSRQATACATEDCQVLTLKLTDLMTKIFKRNPKVAIKLFTNLSHKLASDTMKAGNEISKRKLEALVEAQENPDRYLEELISLVDEIVKDGTLDIEEQMELDRLIYADGIVSPEEQEQLDRINAMLEAGTLSEEKPLEELVDDIIEDGVVTTDELQELNDRIYADNFVTDEEKAQLDRIESMIENGTLVQEDPLYSGIFQQMTDRQVKWLKNNFETKVFPKDSRVYSQGDYGDYMLVLMKGKFQQEADKLGKKSIVGTVFEGDVIGGFSLLCKDYVRPTSIIALEDAEVLFVSEQGLEMMVEKNVKVAAQLYYNLLCMFSGRLEKSMKLLHQ